MKKAVSLIVALIMVASLGLTASADSGAWQRDDWGWWYKNADESYPAGKWQKIDGIWYHFNDNGYMQTGWLFDGYGWYYLSGSGAMATGWQYIGGSWYYLYSSGLMATGWVYSGYNWYYMNASGHMVTGWLDDGKNQYYMNSSGAMVTGTVYIDGKEYTFDAGGALQSSVNDAPGQDADNTQDNSNVPGPGPSPSERTRPEVTPSQTGDEKADANKYSNLNNNVIEANTVSIKPYEVYYDGNQLVAKCYILNGLDHTVKYIDVKNLQISNQAGVIAKAEFGELKNINVASRTSTIWTFVFQGSAVFLQNADLNTISCQSSVTID